MERNPIIPISKNGIFDFSDLTIELTRCVGNNQQFSQALLLNHRESLIALLLGSNTNAETRKNVGCVVDILINVLPGKTMMETGIIL